MSQDEIEEQLNNDITTLDIFPNNQIAFELFRDLPVDKSIGMGGVFYNGFKRSEIESVMNMHEISKGIRRETLSKLRVMENKVVEILNSKK